MNGTLKGKTVDAKLWAPVEEIESGALDQIRNVASLPWIRHVSIMPDVHAGYGVTIGSVLAMKEALSPSAVGVDIGCGCSAIKTNLTASDLPDSLAEIRATIESTIPVGFNGHVTPPKALKKQRDDLMGEFKGLHAEGIDKQEQRASSQLGTLGGGNHFIELCLDTEDRVWLMLHSGSRGIGKEIAERHIKIAKVMEHNRGLPDPELAVFLGGTPEMAAYRNDLFWAQRYAALNRAVMLDLYKGIVRAQFPNVTFDNDVACHHNYVAEERHFGEDLFVTRKGAISAAAGQYGIIPGSMGTKSYIVKGLGNPDALCSASHGAGRRMSRGAAKRQFTIEDLAAQTAGVECRKDAGVIDEIPGAYKSIDRVMENQKDLVEVVATLKAVLCVKG